MMRGSIALPRVTLTSGKAAVTFQIPLPEVPGSGVPRRMASAYTTITRQDFMHFFRDDEMLNQLSADDRVEIFSQVLTGSSDITKELLDELLSDYSVGNLEVVER